MKNVLLMQIIILGAGLVGTSLAEHLLSQNHNISIIEKNRERCESVGENLDALIVHGTGADPIDLESAGIEDADMLIASTPIDEVNIIACMLAKQYNVKHRIARIRNRNFVDGASKISLEELGITNIIYPERNTLEAVLNFIETPFAIDAVDFEGRSVFLRSYKITAEMPIANKSLVQLRMDSGEHLLLVVAIIRDDEVVIPRGDTIILCGDKPLFVFSRDSLQFFLSQIGLETGKNRKAVVFGNTLTSVNIANALQQELDSVVFIDPDPEHAEEAASLLRGMDVLLGNGDDTDVLREANIRNADYFIAAAEHSDENILSCLLAKAEGAKEVLAIVNDNQHIDLFHSIGISHVINPRQLTAAGILNAIHPGFVSSSLHIEKTDIDVLRFTVHDQSSVSGKSLQESWGKAIGKAVVGAVFRNKEIIVPSGATVLMPGDLVLVFSLSAGLKRLNKMFGAPGRV
jgi:trk/ktr system potassium uptake protein